MKKWAIAVILGVLMPYPINLLAQYLAQLQAGSGNVWYGYALSALMFFSYLFLGVYLARLNSLRTAGTARRVRWAELALGVVLLLMSLVMKLEQATGLVTANIDFIRNSAVLTAIVRFNDGLYLWVVLAGFFLADAFERVPAQSEARVETPRVKKVKTKKAKAKAAEPAEAQPSAIASAQAAPEGQTQPSAVAPTQAVPEVQIQPGVVAPTEAAPVEANPGT